MDYSLRNRSNSSLTTETELLLPEATGKPQVLSSFSDYDQFKASKTNSINIYTTVMEEMPSWYVADSYLKTGYRRITNSIRGCLLSLLYLHNESINVYTHLIGSVLLFPIGIFTISYYMDLGDYIDKIFLLVYLSGLFACLSLSTTFHLFCCHSKTVSKVTNKADYVGIVCLQVGSFLPTLYYGFYCDSLWRWSYSVAITLLGLMAVGVTVGPTYAAVQYRWLRTVLFGAFGGIGIVPSIHHVWRYGITMSWESFALQEIILMGVLYVTGALIYASRIPERFYPKTFDIFGSSHQIWHLFVLAASAMHFKAIYKVYTWWQVHNSECLVSDQEMMDWFK